MQLHLWNTKVKFVYHSHLVEVKVTYLILLILTNISYKCYYPVNQTTSGRRRSHVGKLSGFLRQGMDLCINTTGTRS